jgi:hypothetical protein
MDTKKILEIGFTKKESITMVCCLMEAYIRKEVPKRVLIRVMNEMAGEGPSFFSHRSKAMAHASVVTSPGSEMAYGARYHQNYYNDNPLRLFLEGAINKYALVKSFAIAMGHNIDSKHVYELSHTPAAIHRYNREFMYVIHQIMTDSSRKLKFVKHTKHDIESSILRRSKT